MGAFFLASNGLLYRDPLIRGEGWYMVFDGHDEPELIVAKADLDPTRARLRAVSILEQSGISALISGPPRLMMRAYNADGSDTRDSFCFWLDVCEPLPAALLAGQTPGVVEPPGDARVNAFGQPWGKPVAA